MERALYLGYESLKSASKTHSERLVRPSNIFVWWLNDNDNGEHTIRESYATMSALRWPWSDRQRDCRYIYHSFFVIILQTCEHPMAWLSHAMCCINKWRPFWNCQTACSGSGRAHLPLNSSRVTSVTRRAFVADATHRFRRFYRGAATSWYHDDVSFHVGNNISAKYPRRICK